MKKEDLKKQIKSIIKEHFSIGGGVICLKPIGTGGNPFPTSRLPVLKRDFATTEFLKSGLTKDSVCESNIKNVKLLEAISKIAKTVSKKELVKEDIEEIAYKIIKSYKNENYASIISELKREIVKNGYKILNEGNPKSEKLIKEDVLPTNSTTDIKNVKDIFSAVKNNPTEWLDNQSQDIKDSFERLYNVSISQ